MDPGISDDAVLGVANQDSAILITSDRDFGELVFRQARIAQGIILVRLAGLSPAMKAEIVSAVIKKHIPEIEHAFSVISPGMIRIRHVIGVICGPFASWRLCVRLFSFQRLTF